MIRYVQGDVILKLVDKFPTEGEIDQQSKDKILAFGEVTGHAHRISSGTCEMKRVGMNHMIKAITAITITHEEHKPITLPPGNYQVEIARETDWLTQTVRRVAD